MFLLRVRTIFRRIASGAGFSLCGFVLARTKTHRLKPVPLGHYNKSSMGSAVVIECAD